MPISGNSTFIHLDCTHLKPGGHPRFLPVQPSPDPLDCVFLNLSKPTCLSAPELGPSFSLLDHLKPPPLCAQPHSFLTDCRFRALLTRKPDFGHIPRRVSCGLQPWLQVRVTQGGFKDDPSAPNPHRFRLNWFGAWPRFLVFKVPPSSPNVQLGTTGLQDLECGFLFMVLRYSVSFNLPARIS